MSLKKHFTRIIAVFAGFVFLSGCRTREKSTISSVDGSEVVKVELASNAEIELWPVINVDPAKFEEKYPSQPYKFVDNEAKQFLAKIKPIVLLSIKNFIGTQNDPRHGSFHDAVMRNFKMLNTNSPSHKLLIRKVKLSGLSAYYRLNAAPILVGTFLSVGKSEERLNDVSTRLQVSIDLVDATVYQEGNADGILASIKDFNIYLAGKVSNTQPKVDGYKFISIFPDRESFYFYPETESSESFMNYFSAVAMPKAIDHLAESFRRK